jgi:hypothetical protein
MPISAADKGPRTVIISGSGCELQAAIPAIKTIQITI